MQLLSIVCLLSGSNYGLHKRDVCTTAYCALRCNNDGDSEVNAEGTDAVRLEKASLQTHAYCMQLVVSIILSFLIYPKPITWKYVFGGMVRILRSVNGLPVYPYVYDSLDWR